MPQKIQNREDYFSFLSDYISSGLKINELESKISSLYAAAPISFEKAYRKTKLDERHPQCSVVKILCKKLGVPEDKQQEYLSGNFTIYSLLVDLRKNGRATVQIDFILSLIDKQLAMPTWMLGTLGALALGLVAGVVSTLGVPTVATIAQSIIAAVGGIPVAGLAGTGLLALYTLYDNQFDAKRSYFERFRENFFVFSQAALNTASYVLWIAAATAVMTPLVAGLSVAAAGVDVVKEVFYLVNSFRKFINVSAEQIINLKSGHETPEQAALREQNFLRAKSEYVKHTNATIINFFAAVALVGIIAVWNFFPPTLVVTVGSVILMGVVYGVKAWLTKRNERNIQNELTASLQASAELASGKSESITLQADRSPTSANQQKPDSKVQPGKNDSEVKREKNDSENVGKKTFQTFLASSFFFCRKSDKHKGAKEEVSCAPSTPK
jgi:hypothetical protein